MRRIVWLAALVCVLALVPPGSARDEKVVKLRVGDLIDVAGTQIACQIVVSGALSPGRTSVSCLKEGAQGLPVAGSYAVTLTATGAVEAYMFTKKRQVKPVYRHKAGLGVQSRYITARPGDLMLVPNSDIVCGVRKPSGAQAYVVCFRANSKGLQRTGSYTILCSDRLVAILHIARDGSPRQVFEHSNP